VVSTLASLRELTAVIAIVTAGQLDWNSKFNSLTASGCSRSCSSSSAPCLRISTAQKSGLFFAVSLWFSNRVGGSNAQELK
jgi:hypothetical protein